MLLRLSSVASNQQRPLLRESSSSSSSSPTSFLRFVFTGASQRNLLPTEGKIIIRRQRKTGRKWDDGASLLPSAPPEEEEEVLVCDSGVVIDDLSRVLRGVMLLVTSPTRPTSLPFIQGFPRELPPTTAPLLLPASSTPPLESSSTTTPSALTPESKSNQSTSSTTSSVSTDPSTKSTGRRTLVEPPPPLTLTIVPEDQKLPGVAQERSVPSSRVARLWHFSGLALGMGMGALSEGLKRSVGISDPSTSSGVLLNEANVDRLVATLCRMRGAALKIGQVLSIQDSALIPPPVQEAFERVRKGADYMTSRQLESVMREEHGETWREKFVEFSEVPFAAASIGQVHRALIHPSPPTTTPASTSTPTPIPTEIALKVQYPGVRESIDSDINNLLSLLKLTGLMPTGLYVENVLKSAKEELQLETDYVYEAECQQRFQRLISDDPSFSVPTVFTEFSTQRTLATSLVRGLPLEKLVAFPEATRNWVAKKLMELCLRELFEFGFMQTDPNWCNFFYDPQEQKIHLLDFGASREYSATFCEEYLELVYAASRRDRDKILDASIKLGFLSGEENRYMLQAHADAVTIIGEPFAQDEPYDFQGREMTKRIHQLIPIMLKNRLKPPPPESYSLHRKLSGTFLLCTKLNASISCKDLLHDLYHRNRLLKKN